jgi:hypothetical protein
MQEIWNGLKVMEVMVDLEEATPAELRIVDVEIRRNNRRQTIEEIIEADK